MVAAGSVGIGAAAAVPGDPDATHPAYAAVNLPEAWDITTGSVDENGNSGTESVPRTGEQLGRGWRGAYRARSHRQVALSGIAEAGGEHFDERDRGARIRLQGGEELLS